MACNARRCCCCRHGPPGPQGPWAWLRRRLREALRITVWDVLGCFGITKATIGRLILAAIPSVCAIDLDAAPTSPGPQAARVPEVPPSASSPRATCRSEPEVRRVAVRKPPVLLPVQGSRNSPPDCRPGPTRGRPRDSNATPPRESQPVGARTGKRTAGCTPSPRAWTEETHAGWRRAVCRGYRPGHSSVAAWLAFAQRIGDGPMEDALRSEARERAETGAGRGATPR